MKDYVICFIKISDVDNSDVRIPSEIISAVYKLNSVNEPAARESAGKLFLSENPKEILSNYVISCGYSG